MPRHAGIGWQSAESCTSPNSFFPSKTTMADYTIEDPSRDPEVMERWARSSSELSGYTRGGRQADLDLVPLFLANATPKGQLTDETYNTLVTTVHRPAKGDAEARRPAAGAARREGRG